MNAIPDTNQLATATEELRLFRQEVAGVHIAKLTELTEGEEARNVAAAEGETDRNEQVTAKMASVDPALQNHPILRQSPNQFGNLNAAGDLEGWMKNGNFDIQFSEVRTIPNGVPFDDRPQEDQDVLAAMGRGNAAFGRYFQPAIKILRMDWSGAPSGSHHSLYPGLTLGGGNNITTGSYARLLSGDIRSEFFNGITDEWGVCGENYDTLPGQYFTHHPYVFSEAGSVEFFWPAVVNGFVDLRRAAPGVNPRWSYYPSLFAAHNRDTTV